MAAPGDTSGYTLYVMGGGGMPDAAPVPVCVTRKRVRNLNLRVRRDGSVALSVPWHTSRERAQAFLDERAGWIVEHRRRVAERARATELAEACGRAPVGAFPLWGELRACATPLSPEEVAARYRSEVARVLPEVAARMEALVGARATGWQLRDMKTRWGSCTPGTGRIRINVRLAAYAPACLEYVVAHELAHLLEASHNARFHAIVARAIPNEREVRALLRKGPLEA